MLVWSKKEVERFFEYVVPEIKKDEVLCVILCARKKYDDRLTRSVEMLDKLILKSNNVRKLIRFLRVEDGDFVDKEGKPIPIKSMACYIDLCPKSCLNAVNEFDRVVRQWIIQAIRDENFDLSVFRKLDTKLFSAIHKSNSRTPVKIVDVDKKDGSVLEQLPEPDWLTETRGGYHCIYHLPEQWKVRRILHVAETVEEAELQWYHGRTVIPGTLQGGFKVRGLDLNNFNFSGE